MHLVLKDPRVTAYKNSNINETNLVNSKMPSMLKVIKTEFAEQNWGAIPELFELPAELLAMHALMLPLGTSFQVLLEPLDPQKLNLNISIGISISTSTSVSISIIILILIFSLALA